MRILASKKLALALIIALAILAVVGMTIPQDQPGQTGYSAWKARHAGLAPVVEFLQLQKMFSSWWIKIVYFLFLINILCCTYLQIRRLQKAGVDGKSGPGYKELAVGGTTDWAQTVKSYLDRRGYKTGCADDETGGIVVIGRKSYYSRWSGVIFHTGLLVVITGILISALAISDGIIPIIEGQQVTEDKDTYIVQQRGILAGGFTRLPLSINKISVVVDKKKKSIASFKDDVQFGNDRFLLDSRIPAVSNGFTVYRDKIGYTLTIDVKPSDGSAFTITFPLLRENAKPNVFANEINLPQTRYTLAVVLYPNAAAGQVGTVSQYSSNGDALLNPLVNIDARDYTAGKIKNSYLKPGDKMDLNNFRIGIAQIGYWSSLRLVKDPGVNIIYLGFAVSVAALVMMYLMVPKEILVEVDKNVIRIAGWTSHYRNLFREELEDLYNYLAEGGVD